MTSLVLGGPGCGKTTYLLGIVEEALERGVPPNRIGYVAFTRKAAQEARDRMTEKFGIDPDDIPYFSTLHSLAFKQLGLTPEQVLNDDLFLKFAKVEGFQFSRAAGPGEYVMKTEDDRALSALSFARLTRRPLQEVCQEFDVGYSHARMIEGEVAAFKRDRAVVDYTDMIEQFVNVGDVPRFELLIVDEAQDLSHLQWEMVEKLARGVEDVYFAGDDDQAIYEWAGADLEYFLAIKGKQIVLPNSYRLPRAIFNVAQGIIARVENRYQKDWKPRDEEGRVEFIDELKHLDLANGSWYMLARNEYLLTPVKAYLWDEGIPFFQRGPDGNLTSTMDCDEVRAIITWEKLRRGKLVGGTEITNVYQFLGNNLEPGFNAAEFDLKEVYSMEELLRSFGLRTDDDWMKALKLPPRIRHHVRAAKENEESLTQRPRITCSTIHGVKGGEADNVFLRADVSQSSFQSLMRDISNESRVFFVGVSRAKHNLYIQTPRTPRYFDMNGALA